MWVVELPSEYITACSSTTTILLLNSTIHSVANRIVNILSLGKFTVSKGQEVIKVSGSPTLCSYI